MPMISSAYPSSRNCSVAYTTMWMVQPRPGTLPPNVSAAVNGVALFGTLAGQLFFGWLGDKMGRKRVYGMTLMLMVICSVASGLSFGSSPKSCYEHSMLLPVLAWVWDWWSRPAFKAKFSAPAYEVDAIASTVPQADYVWRIILMVGALPAALTYYSRTKMPETARYTALVAKNAKKAASDMSKVLQVDIEAEPQKVEEVTKAQNLFQKDIFSAIGWIPPAKTMNAIDEVYKIAKAQTLIALCSTVPGYWFTVAFIDRMGRFAIQLMGFFFMTVFMFALALPYDHWTRKDNRIGFVVMYSLTFFFANFGPNATTFVVPAEIFPARFRSTCHGISAASGKAGAIVGAFGFLYLAQSKDKAKADAGYPAGIGVKNALLYWVVSTF
ncbi:putative inorganic phosphate transporter 1-7 [Vitis vinifera]|uniref:Putative inorganic phosphate transporter 1-7 n=1 Tax=Vitis vinifera TaxID=29760 RepID=A0A438KDE5_VITVI|nr:putative inorganic phosphate transporter 1-7 [Vitis vinifera]